MVVLCDVQNFLLGENGSAAVFGPQKGASPDSIAKLEAALNKLSEAGRIQTGMDMSGVKCGGTAGGAAAGLYAFLNAKLVSGIDYFLSLTDFNEALQNTDLVVTGEGSIDEQTLQGKGPFGVAESAKRLGLPVIGMAGYIPLEPNAALKKYFDALIPINNELCDLKTALLNTKSNLVRTAKELGNLIALGMASVDK